MKQIIVGFVVALVLAGCGSTRTTYTTDKMGVPMQTTEERSFFASENLGDYYKFESARIDKHSENVDKKLTALKETSAARMTTIKATAQEAQLMSIIDSLLIAAIPTDPLAAGKAPKTMADTLDANFWLNALNTGKTWYDSAKSNRNQSKNDGDDITVVNNGNMGDVNSKSFNKTGTLTVDGQSTGYIDFSKGKDESQTTTQETQP